MLNAGDVVKVYLGGEAEVRIYENIVVKKRKPKRYRIEELDRELRFRRTRSEARIMSQVRRVGVATPIVLDIGEDTIVMERIIGRTAKECMNEEVAEKIGAAVARMHSKDVVHGDVTPMNIILKDGVVYFVDFGLAFYDARVEAKGVDVHVFFESLKALYDDWEKYRDAFVRGYIGAGGSEEVIERAKEIEIRGRYVERRLRG